MEVGVHYDPMLAKLIVSGSDRAAAIARMRRALQELKITGVATNVSFLLTLLESEAFRSGEYHTRWVEEHLEELVRAPAREELFRPAVLAAAIHREIRRRRSATAVAGEDGSAWRLAGRRRALERWRP
jgi:acetyl/propionyl-CoA carboxylase alpha subunit